MTEIMFPTEHPSQNDDGTAEWWSVDVDKARAEIKTPTRWLAWVMAQGWPVTMEYAESLGVIGRTAIGNARNTLLPHQFIVESTTSDGVRQWHARRIGDGWTQRLEPLPEPPALKKTGRRKRVHKDTVKESSEAARPTIRQPRPKPASAYPSLGETLTVRGLSLTPDGVVTVGVTTRSGVAYTFTVE